MSVNKYQPHLLVIPEDDANRDIFTGFLNHRSVNSRRVHVENVAGGWTDALDLLINEHARGMRRYDKRHVLILIDFDRRENRFEQVWTKIPKDLRNRVFIMGCQDEPERVRDATGLTKEQLGEALAKACVSGEAGLWDNPILAHNLPELERMRMTICPALLES
ncbi:MAG: hypothetical protein MUF31_08245 [Akkermansiaceae bacterium]|jgi:hypothetical protein|nr:hypothetical protein [Akkermansiaceae bacterium]